MTTISNEFPADWQELYDSWPPVVTRQRIWEDTRLLRPQTLANYDSQGEGITGKHQAGRQVVYPKRQAIKWLIEYVNR